MSKPISMPNAKDQLTRDIDRKGLATPVETILREGVVNGSEANRRRLGSARGKIFIKMDEVLGNKLAIINQGGEFFDEDKALNHLNTIAGSGNDGYDQSGLALNMGQGAKISYLPHASQGLLYRSKSDTGLGHTFHLKRIDNENYYGIQSKWCEEIQEITEFQHCEKFNSELADEKISGTEMILMGDKVSDNTWEQLCEKCATGRGKQTGKGWPIFKKASNRFFRDIGDDILVAIYDKEGQHGYRKVVPTYESMIQTKSYGIMPLEGKNIPEGTILHYCLKEDYRNLNSSAKFSVLGGSVYFVWKKEMYFNPKEPSSTRAKRLRHCGIWHKPTEWILIIELPDNWQGFPSENRTQLTNIQEYEFYSTVCENLPEDIQQWMQDNKNTDIESSDINKWLQDIFKSFQSLSPDNSSSGAAPTSAIPSVLGSLKTSSGNSQNSGLKRNKKMAAESLRNFRVPLTECTDDEDAPLVEFLFDQYAILLNTSHPIYCKREEGFFKEYSHIDTIVIKEYLVKYHFKAALSRIFDVQNLYSDNSIQQRKEKWIPDILEATWNFDSKSAVQRSLNRSK